MNSVQLLMRLADIGAPQWRVDLAAKAVTLKIILKLPPSALTKYWLSLWS